MSDAMILIALTGLLTVVFLILWVRRPRREGRPPASQASADKRQTILVDGSNVIYWLDNTPQFAPLKQVVHDLSLRGFKPGVVFDANIG